MNFKVSLKLNLDYHDTWNTWNNVNLNIGEIFKNIGKLHLLLNIDKLARRINSVIITKYLNGIQYYILNLSSNHIIIYIITKFLQI